MIEIAIASKNRPQHCTNFISSVLPFSKELGIDGTIFYTKKKRQQLFESALNPYNAKYKEDIDGPVFIFNDEKNYMLFVLKWS